MLCVCPGAFPIFSHLKSDQVASFLSSQIYEIIITLAIVIFIHFETDSLKLFSEFAFGLV